MGGLFSDDSDDVDYVFRVPPPPQPPRPDPNEYTGPLGINAVSIDKDVLEKLALLVRIPIRIYCCGKCREQMIVSQNCDLSVLSSASLPPLTATAGP